MHIDQNMNLVAAAIANPFRWTYGDHETSAIFCPANGHIPQNRLYYVAPKNWRRQTFYFEAWQVDADQKTIMHSLQHSTNYTESYAASTAASKHYDAYCQEFAHLYDLDQDAADRAEEEARRLDREAAKRAAQAASAAATRAAYEGMNNARREIIALERELQREEDSLFTDHRLIKTMRAALGMYKIRETNLQGILYTKTRKLIQPVSKPNSGDVLPGVAGTVKHLAEQKRKAGGARVYREGYEGERANPFFGIPF